LADGEARIACEIEDEGNVVIGLPLALVSEAKLVLTDDLVREALRRAKSAREGRSDSGSLGDGAVADPAALVIGEPPASEAPGDRAGDAGPSLGGRKGRRRAARPPPT
jgi:hypothetical protein